MDHQMDKTVLYEAKQEESSARVTKLVSVTIHLLREIKEQSRNHDKETCTG